MQKIVPFLWFDGKAGEAAKFYVSIFKNSKVVSVTPMSVTFQLEGQQFYALNGGPQFKFTPAISLFVNCETQQEVDELWNKLSAGGSSAPAGWNGEPERDLRIFGWEPPGEGGVRLIITHPGSTWGRAGLHSGDRLVSVDGAPIATWPDFRARLQRLRIGDTIRIEVRRPTGPFQARVTVSGFERPTVRIESLPNATTGQRALGAQWLKGS